jgi:hypothetical protein
LEERKHNKCYENTLRLPLKSNLFHSSTVELYYNTTLKHILNTFIYIYIMCLICVYIYIYIMCLIYIQAFFLAESARMAFRNLFEGTTFQKSKNKIINKSSVSKFKEFSKLAHYLRHSRQIVYLYYCYEVGEQLNDIVTKLSVCLSFPLL